MSMNFHIGTYIHQDLGATWPNFCESRPKI